MRIAIAQINPVLGDFLGNRKKINEQIQMASEKGAELILFPECALLGYHPFDLLEQTTWIKKQERQLSEIQKQIPKGVAVLLGLITQNKNKKGRPYFNSAVLLMKDKKPQFFHKKLLPTGDVFDEARFIESNKMPFSSFLWKGKEFLVTICEDIWAWPDLKGRSPYEKNPLQEMRRKKYDLVINLSASPYFIGKFKLRENVVKQTAQYFRSPVVYVNMVGAQDEIIYDGRSFVVDARGKTKFHCQAFQEDTNLFQLKDLEPWSPSPHQQSQVNELKSALVLGIKDFCKKNTFSQVHLGLSGGIDSAVVACLAVDALGAQNVSSLALPGPFSSKKSESLAKKLAENLGIKFISAPISRNYQEIKNCLEKHFLKKVFSVTHENLQARLRGLFLMAYSNENRSLLLTTGNKSEYATGYSTLYGDMCGGLAPIADLTKKQVYELAQFYNLEQEIIPHEIIRRAPTAELRPHQKDQDSLPPYEDLDRSVVRIIEKRDPPKSQTDHWLLSVLAKTEFKRWQSAPILKVSGHSFGRGRRWPLTFKWQ